MADVQIRAMPSLCNLRTEVLVQGIMHWYVVVVSSSQARAVMIFLPVHSSSQHDQDGKHRSCADTNDGSSGQLLRVICETKKENRVFGRFPYKKKSRFEFPEIPATNGTACSGIYVKGDNLARYTEIFGNFLLGTTVPFDSRNFRNSRLNGSLFGNSTISGFS